jgi:uncharacterized membrane protein
LPDKIKFTAVAAVISVGILCGAIYLGAQIRIVLTGQINEKTGAPVVKAEVVVQRIGKETSISVWTDSKGEFKITGLPIGEYRLEILKEGFKSFQQRSVLLKPGSKSSINVVLERELKPISRSGTRQGCAINHVG